jgi:hypothetical protein
MSRRVRSPNSLANAHVDCQRRDHDLCDSPVVPRVVEGVEEAVAQALFDRGVVAHMASRGRF